MDTFHQHIGGDHLVQALRIQNGGIIADALHRGGIRETNAGGDALDEAEFAEGGEFGAGG